MEACICHVIKVIVTFFFFLSHILDLFFFQLHIFLPNPTSQNYELVSSNSEFISWNSDFISHWLFFLRIERGKIWITIITYITITFFYLFSCVSFHSIYRGGWCEFDRYMSIVQMLICVSPGASEEVVWERNCAETITKFVMHICLKSTFQCLFLSF